MRKARTAAWTSVQSANVAQVRTEIGAGGGEMTGRRERTAGLTLGLLHPSEVQNNVAQTCVREPLPNLT